MKKAVQFGAGSIGRGFLAQLFSQWGCRVVFIEVKPEMVALLNEKGKYTLRMVGKGTRELVIENVSAVNASDVEKVREEISSADIVATAVGVSALAGIAPLIASGIERRASRGIQAPLNVIICENLLSAGEVLKSHVKNRISRDYHGYLEKYVGFVETVVSRMIPPVAEGVRKDDPLLIITEEYGILPVSKKGFVGEVPDIKGMVAYDNLRAYEERKLFVHNLGHAMCAYAGYQKGYVYIWETVLDKNIVFLVREALGESGEALIRKHGFRNEEIYEHIDDLLERFANRALGDSVSRVGRDPVRKLGPHDRLIGSARLCFAFGISPMHIVKGIVHALHYDNEEDAQARKLRGLMRTKGIDYVLQHICGLDMEETLAGLIRKETESYERGCL